MTGRLKMSRAVMLAATAGILAAGTGSLYAADQDEISVRATRAQTALKDLGVSASVVTATEIEEMDAQDIADALRETTGLRVTTYGAAGSLSEVSIRGSSSPQVLVLVDGRRINKTSDGSVDFSIYKPSDIERIEVLRGPASMIHGANALAGVVNIVTRSVDEEPITSVSAEAGTFNTQSYRFSTSRKIGDVGVRVSAGHSTSDGDRENSASDAYHVIGKLEHTADDSSSSLSIGYATLEAGAPGSTAYPSPSATQDDERSWADFTHRRLLTDTVELTTKLFFNDNALLFKDPDQATDDSVENMQYGADIQADIPIGERNTVIAGVYYERGEVEVEDKDGASKIGGKQSVDTYAVFLQDELQLSDDLTVTPAVRFDDYYGLDTEISPKVSARWHATDSSSLRCSVGRGFRPPTVNDLYWQSAFAVGNPDLKAEKSVTWDAGVEQAMGDSVLASLSYFSSDVEDLVGWEPRESDGLYAPFNIAEAMIRGVELELKAKLHENINAALTYTWMETEDNGDFSGKELQYKPEHRASGRVSYADERGLSVSVALAYTDSVYSDQDNTETLDSYLLLDARIAKTIGDHTVFVSGRNLLDEEYSVINGYPMPGATVNGGIELLF